MLEDVFIVAGANAGPGGIEVLKSAPDEAQIHGTVFRMSVKQGTSIEEVTKMATDAVESRASRALTQRVLHNALRTYEEQRVASGIQVDSDEDRLAQAWFMHGVRAAAEAMHVTVPPLLVVLVCLGHRTMRELIEPLTKEVID